MMRFQARMTIEEVTCPDCGRRFRFTPPLVLTRQEEAPDLWLYDDGVLDFVACGDTDEAVAAALGDDVCYAYTHFAERDPRHLSPEARQYRAMVLARVMPLDARARGDRAHGSVPLERGQAVLHPSGWDRCHERSSSGDLANSIPRAGTRRPGEAI